MGEIILDEKMKNKLLGVAPYNTTAIYEYVSKYHRRIKDLPENFIPVFTLTSFTKVERNNVSKLLSTTEFSKAENKELRTILRPKIKGWKNLYDIGDGKEIVFDNTEETFDRLPDNICSDLLMEVIKISGLLDIDRLSLKY